MPRDMPCVLQTRVSSLAHEKFQNEARKLGVSAADLLRIVVLRVIQKDISVEAVVSFKKGMDSVQEMKKLRRGEKHELLDEHVEMDQMCGNFKCHGTKLKITAGGFVFCPKCSAGYGPRYR